MKKIVKGAICAGLALAMCAAVGCNKKQSLDPETRQLDLAIGALDGNFNPFTYTSGNDSEMIGMTQLSLLTVDSEGHVTCGPNEVCAAQSMEMNYFDANNVPSTVADKNGFTEYVITLKKGIMYSDGVHELGIKDVLFNLYVYLDPAYTGSTTIYSTDIVGLRAYRTQDPDSNSLNVDSNFDVNGRIQNIIDWTEDGGEPSAEVAQDLELVNKLYKEEIEADWNAIATSWEETYKGYYFTETWQAYLFYEGLVTTQKKLTNTNNEVQIYFDADGNGKYDASKGDKYYTTLEPYQEGAKDAYPEDIANGVRGADEYIKAVNDNSTEAKIAEYMQSHDGLTKEEAKTALQKEACLKLLETALDSEDSIAEIVQFRSTGNELYNEILGQLRTEYYDNVKKGGKLPVPNIEGITTDKTADGNDVLKIKIHGVDPKAAYNWAFPVAPLYYYSCTNYKGHNYVEEADPANNKFGVEFGDSNFFKEAFTTEKQGVPVGAGAYKACDKDGNDNPTKATFCLNTVNCYFKRNDYFETLGGNIKNAKIKRVAYKVVSDNKIMEALGKGEIDFGKPNATRDNGNFVTSHKNTLASKHYPTGGYGYIGVNPKFVPEYKVRQAIMKSIDTSLAISDFYTSTYAEPIYRPMTKTSWAYPDETRVNSLPASVAYDNSPDRKEIKKLMEEAGYDLEGNKYVKRRQPDGMANKPIGSTIKLTFIIAGDSTDHPAYMMFSRAADTLNSLGFDITVDNSALALKSLISGDLAVWAAAWTSSSDPDMYQIYHKESAATSVNNWNYKNILGNKGGYDWTHEQGIIEDLSKKIDEARTFLKDDERIPLYEECLDFVMDLAVELPSYQRHDLCVYNKTVISAGSLVQSPNCYIGLFDKIWEINYV
ncbi:MAG: hypothetical protein K2N22_05480 [Clostridia bacterium]|nr:hypothetical protein [Clostridia bacterium]